MKKSIDILGKLLATENISIVRSNCKTAFFNVETRVLTIPTWKNMTDEIEAMLMSHEVGHALFTDSKKWTQVQSESNIKHSYLNVIEDVRIERLMKNKYPGIRKTFFEGYKQLHEQDFAKISKIDLDKTNLIDRINLFFKFGIFLPELKFSPEEMVFINRAEKIVTIDEAAQLARDIYEYSKEQQKKKEDEENDLPEGLNLEERIQEEDDGYSDEDDEEDNDDSSDSESSDDGEEDNDESSDEGENDDSSDSESSDDGEEDNDESSDSESSDDGEEESDESDIVPEVDSPDDTTEDPSDEDDELAPQKNNHGTDSSDDTESFTNIDDGIDDDSALDSLTEQLMSQSLEDMVDYDNMTIYWELNSDLPYNPIVDYTQVIEDLVELDEKINSEWHNEKYNELMTESTRVVSYLAKEFELKKSAHGFQRAQISKSGSIDSNRLFSYQINDDIFKRIMSIPNEKNHGMIFLLDWSGSMSSEMTSTIKQLINLVLFCRRINIPFEVYAFSNYYNVDDTKNLFTAYSRVMKPTPKPIAFYGTYFHLLNFFSSRMTNLETHQMIRRLLNPNALYNTDHNYYLGGTPLNDALLFTMELIQKFKNKNNIEKMTLITLTDGNGHDLDVSNYKIDDHTLIRGFSRNYYKYDDMTGVNQKIMLHHFIKDPKTQKIYPVNMYDTNTSMTQNLLSMIKDRYDITILGFHISKNRNRALMDAITDNFGRYYFTNNNISSDEYIRKIRDEMSSNGVALIKNSAHDMLFLIKSNIVTDDSELGNIEESESAAKIAKKFGKTIGNRLHSRILLDKFSELSF